MNPKDLVGQACIVRRVDSPGNGAHARIDRVEPSLPFPIHASWHGSIEGAWFLSFELEPSRLA